jgi:hypothetical protein
MLKRYTWLGILALTCPSFWGAFGATLPSCDPLTASERGYVKFFPGHYIAVGASRAGNDQLAMALNEIKDIPKVIGIQKRYYWSNLQTGPNTYDFTLIKNDIAKMKSQNKKLSIFIQWKFKSDDGLDPAPAFLSSLTDKPTMYALGGEHMGPYAKGYLTAMDNPVVANAFVAFLKKLAGEIDNDPAVSSIVFVETAMGTQLADYTAEQKSVIQNNYYDQVLRIDKEASCAFKHTPVIQLTNFPSKRLGQMTDAYKAWGIAYGGPDVWLNDPTMSAYSYYPSVSQEVPIGMVAAGGNMMWFNHEDEITNDPAQKIPYPASEIIQKIFQKAKNELSANYIFWRKLGPADPLYVSLLNQVKNIGTASATIQDTRVTCPPGMGTLCKSDGFPAPAPAPTPTPTPTTSPSPSPTVSPAPLVLRDGGIDRRVRDGWGDEMHIHP